MNDNTQRYIVFRYGLTIVNNNITIRRNSHNGRIPNNNDNMLLIFKKTSCVRST